jgi:hypothetical protein
MKKEERGRIVQVALEALSACVSGVLHGYSKVRHFFNLKHIQDINFISMNECN